jgi:hypothetical protein
MRLPTHSVHDVPLSSYGRCAEASFWLAPQVVRDAAQAPPYEECAHIRKVRI